MSVFNFIRISPSIIAVDYKNNDVLLNSLKQIENAGAELLHLDVMDGKFVSNKTFDYSFIEDIKQKTNLLLDVHLMVEDPDSVIDNYLKVGVDILTIHFEASKNIKQTLQKIKDHNCLAGIAINPGTSVIKIKDILLSGLVDVVLVMGVEPGACGKTFIPGSAEKVAEIKDIAPKVEVEVDGGVNIKNSKILRKLGASILVSGSTIFSSKNISKTIKELKGKNKILNIFKRKTK